MFALTFDRGLLPFELNTPAFVPLFQLPPDIQARRTSNSLRNSIGSL